MAESDAVTPLFIFDQRSFDQTKKKQELERSRAKSHASQYAHRKWYSQLSNLNPTKRRLVPRIPPTQVGRKKELRLTKPEQRLENFTGECWISTLIPITQESTSWKWTNGYKKDPFNCMPGGNHPSAILAMEFLAKEESRILETNSPFNVFTVYGTWMFEPMSKHKDVFHLCVALIKHNSFFRGGVPHDETAMREIYQRQSLAMEALRNRIAEDDDDSIIMTIWMLALLSGTLGDFKAKTLHENSMRALITQRGGPNHLQVNSHLKQAMWQIAHYEELVTQSPAPTLTYPSALLDLDKTFMRVPPEGFHNVIRAGLVSCETMTTICKLSIARVEEPASTICPISTPPSLVVEPDSLHLYFSFIRECPALALPDLPNDEGPPLDKLICMALVRFCANGRTDCSLRTGCAYHQLLDKLTTYIRSFKVTDTTQECLLWIWLVVISSWAYAEEDTKTGCNQGVQLAQEMQKLYPETMLWSSEDYSRYGQRFFWNEISLVRLESVLARTKAIQHQTADG